MLFVRIFLLAVIFSGTVQAVDFSIGVSPNLINLGDVNPGDQKLVKFSVFTVSDEPLLVYFDSEGGNMDFFNAGYGELKPQFSEEPTATWVEFISNPVEIETNNKTNGRSWKDVNFLINVPKDAEPGYHVTAITPKPTTYGSIDTPIGTTIVSVTKITMLFNVAGNARRDGVILDATAHSYSSYGFTLKTFFRNTGTVTLFSHANSRIYDSNGTYIGEFSSSNEYAKPQSTVTFSTPVNSRIAPGDYKVSSDVVFTTGSATKDTAITLSPYETAALPLQEQEFPWTAVILIIGAIIIVIIAKRWFGGKRA